MLIKTVSLAVAGAGLLVLVGCNSSPEPATNDVISLDADAGEDLADEDFQLEVKASRIFRCEARGRIYVDLLVDDVTARLRRNTTDAPTTLRAPAPGQPFVAEGYVLSADGKRLEVNRPGQDPMVCTR